MAPEYRAVSLLRICTSMHAGMLLPLDVEREHATWLQWALARVEESLVALVEGRLCAAELIPALPGEQKVCEHIGKHCRKLWPDEVHECELCAASLVDEVVGVLESMFVDHSDDLLNRVSWWDVVDHECSNSFFSHMSP